MDLKICTITMQKFPPQKYPPTWGRLMHFLGVCIHRKPLAPCWGTPNVPSRPPLLREAPYGKYDGNGLRLEDGSWCLWSLMWPCDAINILSNNCHLEDVQLMLSEGQQPCWRLEPTPWKPQQDLVGTKLHLMMANTHKQNLPKHEFVICMNLPWCNILQPAMLWIHPQPSCPPPSPTGSLTSAWWVADQYLQHHHWCTPGYPQISVLSRGGFEQ